MLLALSGGGDSVGAYFCLHRVCQLASAVVIDHSLRYEGICEPSVKSVFVCGVVSVGACAHMRRQRIALLVSLAYCFGVWNLWSAHTLSDNYENILGRHIGGAYSLCMPKLRYVLRIILEKPWVCSRLRANAHFRYVNDLLNVDANNLRTLLRQLCVNVCARCYWSALARMRLTSALLL
ncbi:hypothetical protein AADW59_00530 [Candidatus Hodgkinia cicadicola]